MTTLVPKCGSPWLSVAAVVERAQREFACVVTDNARAIKHLADALVSMKADVDHRAADEYLKPLAESVQMICADDSRSDRAFLKCYVIPERPIEVVYHFDGHEAASASLLDRLARVLDYAISK